MHWVIQQGFDEPGFDELIRVLDRLSLPYSLHKVVPFAGQIEPDVNPTGPVIVVGSYAMRHIAAKKGWQPGSFVLKAPFYKQIAMWHRHMLNVDGWVYEFGRLEQPAYDPFFMRPEEDSKAFTGAVFDWNEYADWRDRVNALEVESSAPSLTSKTKVIVARPKTIQAEYRLFVVDGRVVTGSLYKQGGRPMQGSIKYGEFGIVDFAEQRAREWSPHRAFVMDVALVEDGIRIIEINNLNAAGFYAANVGKLVEALENVGYKYK